MNKGVLHFVARWLPASEGFVYDLVRTLSPPGVVVSTWPLENTDRFVLKDVNSLAPLRRLRPPGLQRRMMTLRLMALAARHGVGLVHVHHGYESYQVLGLVHRRRLPLVLSLHGDDVTGLLAAKPDYYRVVVSFATTVVVPSRFLVSYAVQAGFDESRIRVMPSGIDLESFAPSPLPDGPPEVLFVGRFVEKKGLDVLAQAWPAVTEKVPDARLRVMGFGALEPLARAIDGRVEVSLSPTRTQVRDAMRRARLVVSPSHRAGPDDAVESLLVVNVEAQACGRPVVTTDHGGIPEHVRAGETALVVPEGDPSALAEALIDVLSDDGLARRLAAAGPKWAARYDIRHTAKEMESLYDEVTTGESSARSAFP